MAYAMTKRGSQDNCVTYEFICDTIADMNAIEKKYRTIGSIAIVLSGESEGLEVYITGSDKQWNSLTTTTTSTNTNTSGFSIEISSPDAYGFPNVEEPDESTIYLILASEDNGNLYEEYIYVNEAWEKVGAASIDLSGYYQKPVTGIPAADLASGVLPDMSLYAPKASPAFTGSISLDRKSGTTIGENSIAVGRQVEASGDYSFAESNYTKASGSCSHAEGQSTVASGLEAHAEGLQTTAAGNYSHAEGAKLAQGQTTTYNNTSYYYGARGQASHAEGQDTSATGNQSHAEGYQTIALAQGAHSEGSGTRAAGIGAHAEGGGAQATGDYSHAEGSGCVASEPNAHAEGSGTQATNIYAHAEGGGTTASGVGAHSEGGGAQATGNFSHAEGANCMASGPNAHAEGANSYAVGSNAHAEGFGAHANGHNSHAENSGCYATNEGTHAEGGGTRAEGTYSHAEGSSTIAAGAMSHVGGSLNIADSFSSWAEWTANTSYSVGDKVKVTTEENSNTVVNGYICTVDNNDATFTTSHWTQDYKMNYAVIIGNGTSLDDRSNAYALDWDGTGHFAGNVYVNCNNDSTGGSKLATESFVTTRVPTPPVADGTYILQCVVSSGTPTYSWVSLPNAEGGNF